MIKTVLPLSFIAASRFFGLFVVLPTLSIYALSLQGATEKTVGLIIGVYALSQMIFQVPFGVLSDRVGRKKAMVLGLLIFAIGSVVCAVSSDIYTMLAGRVLQGVGAIGGVASAMIADSVSEENRSKAMAIMGAMIGLSFCMAMVFGSTLSNLWGLEGLFYLSAGISLLCVGLLFGIKETRKASDKSDKFSLIKIAKNHDLLILNLTSFLQKMLMSVVFLLVPLVLVNSLGWGRDELWKVYAAGAGAGFLAMGAAGALGDGKGLAKAMLLFGVGLFAVAFLLFVVFGKSSFGFVVGAVIFFVGFNLHEPVMQSCASKFCTHDERGGALGLFTSCGYAGSFIGGALGGAVLGLWGASGVYALALAVCVLWFLLLLRLKNPNEFKNIYVPQNALSKDLARAKLGGIKGIYDVYCAGENTAVKIDTKLINEAKVREILGL
ncbi:MFS transporter [Campylobacter sp. 19-13652]|uniref:MFS transporter n=1 Tax=Campylobacter sp. 19-13652 TaxID=2840180 RepID=UPI001C798FE9|nr:MFS transporter [Campylobacter sp. 19-13652]BCX79983.1 MFS transporter [Campylobacter sp. 19-13652]